MLVANERCDFSHCTEHKQLWVSQIGALELLEKVKLLHTNTTEDRERALRIHNVWVCEKSQQHWVEMSIRWPLFV